MLKLIYFALLFMTASGTIAVQAQTKGPGAGDSAPRPKDQRLLNENYLTPTGETVPRPGLSQGAPTTPLDHKIQQENNSIDKSICSNCN